MRALWLVFCLSLLPASGLAQAIERVPYEPLKDSLSEIIDFEGFRRSYTPGQPLDGIQVFRGARIAERFAGQQIALSEGFEAFHGAPRNPLELRAGPPGQNLSVAFIIFMSNQLSGLAPPGHPARDADGEGAVSILFDQDQAALGFLATSEPDPRDAAVPRGRMRVAFYRRDGSLIDRLDLALDWGIAGYGFRRATGQRDIAGVSITNRDPAGIAIDDIVFDAGLVTGWLLR